ncbi:MAG TPA: tetratricopeptide repeat protein [Polyangia bacterium]|nr:tetratricopeptide repeat protein [Polyangia bacterium]
MRHPLWQGPHISLSESSGQRPLPRLRRLHPAFLAALLPLGLLAARAHAGEVEEANGRLVDLEERVRVLSTGFRETPVADPTVADRRVLDGELLFNLKNYREAATVLLDVVDTYPNSHAYDDAIFLLAESLFQDKDLNSARHYFQQAIQKKTGSRQEQNALERLIEIALRTSDLDQVDDYLARLQNLPAASQQPSVPYVRGKVAYFRDRLDDALAAFQALPTSNPYYLRGRYFYATIWVKKGDLPAGLIGFDTVLRSQPQSDADKEIQDLARLAVGRLYYQRGEFEKARDAYNGILRQSKYFDEAMDELAWTAIKAKDYKGAYRALDLMLLQSPDSPQAPELRLLMGNLHVRVANFALANEAFLQARDEFEPIHLQLRETQKKAEADPKYFETLLGKGLEKFDIAVLVPAKAVKWVKAEPDVARVLALTEDVSDLQRGLKESGEALNRLELAVDGPLQVGIFPDLAMARTNSSEVLNQLVSMRQKFVGKMRSLIGDKLTAEEKVRIEQVGKERAALESELKDLPLSAGKLKDREKQARSDLQQLDARASEFNVEIQGMDAELVAIEQYFIRSRADQKIRPDDLTQPVQSLRQVLSELRDSNERVRSEIAEAAREATVAAATGDSDRNAIALLIGVMRRERDVFQGARGRLSSGEQNDFDAIASVLARADAVQAKLAEFDGRVDAAAQKRRVELKRKLVAEKGELETANGKLTGILNESQSLGGGLAYNMLSKIADRFYDLVVQSDVGLVDVAWGLKDERTGAVSKLINQQKLELKTVEDDFHSLLEEEK